ncbi:hypothetical protein MMC08_007825, partial [Hypocenomyce scalaris]|nr:hypothetical protein [Hypocenomyce scalaris]
MGLKDTTSTLDEIATVSEAVVTREDHLDIRQSVWPIRTPKNGVVKVLVNNCTNSLATCNNYCSTAACRGLFAGTSAFTYDADKNNAKNRRAQSGCSKNPCNAKSGTKPYNTFGSSCDEFPFASTIQGGTGATLRCVDPTENSSTFVKTQNLKSGDSYIVFIQNYAAAYFCFPPFFPSLSHLKNPHLFPHPAKTPAHLPSQYCTSTPNCQNNGGEFVLSGSTFIDARRSRPRSRGTVLPRNALADAFAPAEPDPDGTTPLRTFVAEYGSTYMMLVDSREDL